MDKLERGDVCVLKIGYVSNMPIISFAKMLMAQQISADREIKRSETHVFYEGRPDLVGKEVIVTDVVNEELVQVVLENEHFTVLTFQLEFVKRPAQRISFSKPLNTVKDKTIKTRSTTKTKQAKVFSGSREEQIENCEKCGGNPLLVEFKIPHKGGHFIGERCNECYIIKNYKNV